MTHKERWERRRLIAEAIKGGKAPAEAGHIFGVSETTAMAAAREHGVAKPTGRPRGAISGLSVRTWDVIGALRAKPNRPTSYFSKRFKVTRQRIHQIRQDCIKHGLLEPRR